MKSFAYASILLFASFAGQSEACTASAIPVSPATANRTPIAGASAIAFAISVSLDCTGGETYSISPSASNYTSQIGSTGYYAQSIFFKDAALTQPLFTNPAAGTAAATGAIVTTIYGLVQGTSSLFQGLGTYNLPMSLTATSSGGAPVSLGYTEAGIVQGTCTANNATADFGNFPATTAHPIQPVSLSLNCTAGLPWSMSQPTIANVSIGATTTNTGWLYGDAGRTSPLNTTPLLGSGVGGPQNVNLFAGLAGSTISTPISGAGAVVGAIEFVVTY